MPLPKIDPPLINSSNPWATTTEDLQELYDCQYTGAITTRTSLLHGFEHNDAVHQYTFFNDDNQPISSQPHTGVGSLNTLGYSPFPLSQYLSSIAKIVQSDRIPKAKPCIISVSGSAEAVCECLHRITAMQAELSVPLCMEVNLSCPNIPDKPPPAYSKTSLIEYMEALRAAKGSSKVAVGLKTPPYTYHGQFKVLVDALLETGPDCPIDFITATNTLGSSIVLADLQGTPALSSAAGTGIGGMAGVPLHPLALGNVKIIRSMLDEHENLRLIDIIGIGGVCDKAGFQRMKAVGAKVIGIGTALGSQGVDIFEKVLSD